MEWLNRLREESMRRALTPDLIPSEAVMVEKPHLVKKVG